ncbi:thiol reductant ABC exporter subunit CydD [Rheinheimera sp.]|uniref:thiol reductant ABC exporter subunit CydD n=1 Tax=Rheinheimera sp. TaxID=1869214 RepID=UPI00307F6548
MSHTVSELKDWLAPYRAGLCFSVLAGTLATLLLLLQCWWLAWCCGQLFAGVAISLTDSLWFILCWLGRTVLLALKDLQAMHVSQQARQHLQQQLLQQLELAGPRRTLVGNDGELSTLLLEQVDALDPYLSRYWPQLWLVVLTPLLIATATAFFSPFAACLLLLTAPLIPLFMILLGKKAAQESQRQIKALGLLGGRFLEFLRGFAQIKLLAAEDQVLQQLDEASAQYRRRTMKVLQKAFLSGAVLELLSALAIAFVALYLGLGLLGELPWAKQQVPVPYQNALFMLLLAPEFYAPLRQLGSDYHAKAQAVAAWQSLKPLLQLQVQQGGGIMPAAEPQPLHFATKAFFSAPERPARLAPLQLTVQSGQRVALMGRSGSGKSSVLELVLGYEPELSQQIWLGPHRLSELELTSWRQQLLFLPQQSQWQTGSIRQNLLCRDYDEYELLTALENSQCLEFLQQLPQGLEFELGEAGLGLSGGQLQRLAYARALLKPALYWLLDEPFSMLGKTQQRQLQQQLNRLSQGKTLLLATHQLDGLDWLDQVCYFEAGRLSWQGTVQQARQQHWYGALEELEPDHAEA